MNHFRIVNSINITVEIRLVSKNSFCLNNLQLIQERTERMSKNYIHVK